MKLKGVSGMLMIIFFACGCSSSKKALVANPALEAMMQQEAFEIRIRTVEPQATVAMMQIGNSGLLPPGDNISRIDVAGAGYSIKLEGANVEATLPYYGERQMSGGYGTDVGINFDCRAKDLVIRKDDDTNGFKITFAAKNVSESINFIIAVRPNLRATVQVLSSHRNRISYSGVLKALEKEEPNG